jgi:predicted flap endonuclease-1-like 5' DNA nuclease
MDMNPGSGALLGVWIAAGELSAPAESHGNPWWLWIIVFAVLAAFAGFMLWWWLHDSGEEEVAVPSRHAQAAPATPAPPTAEPDDLRRIEGIGPRIAGVLQDAGISTFHQLSSTEVEQIREILQAEDPRLLRLADPTTWPQQAALAAEGNWPALEALQDDLKGGRRA